MKRPGRAFSCDRASSSPQVSRRIWTKGLAKFSITLCVTLALYYIWVKGPTFISVSTPALQSFEFKIYERIFDPAHSLGWNATLRRPMAMSMQRDEEPLGQMSWTLHGADGDSVSVFYIILEVGSDHKPFFLDIDTGSSLSWIHCRLNPEMKSSKQGPNEFYEAAHSVMGHPILCDEEMCTLADDYHDSTRCDKLAPNFCAYDLNYADHLATRGVLVKDTIGMRLHGTHHVDVELAFGCSYEQTGCEYELGAARLPSDGIIGLSRKRASIPSQLHAKGIIRYIIGHCFLPFYRRHAGMAGVLFLGESTMTLKGIRWAKMIVRAHLILQSTYEGEIYKVKYGKKSIITFEKNNPGSIVLFDSGTSMTWLTKSLYLAIHHHVKTEASRFNYYPMPRTMKGAVDEIGGTRCWKVSASSIDQPFRHFKDISFGFTPHERQCKTCLPLIKWGNPNPKFVMPPGNYLSLKGVNADIICLAIHPEENSTFQTFGAHALQGLVLVMDNELHKIGWRKSEDCK